MVRILVDTSHNERYIQIPHGIFDYEYSFEFLYPGMNFPTYNYLREYDMVIIGEIIPAHNEMDHLFLKTEISLLKKFVKEGGKLFITSSSGGDFEYEREDEDIEDYASIRALSPITGIKRYWWGELFHPTQHSKKNSPEDLIFTEFPDHPIFEGVSEIMLADSTFLEPSSVHTPEILFFTQQGTKFRYYIDDSEEVVDRVPLISYRKLGAGASLVIGSTLFMSNHKNYGINQVDNAKFFFNIINWLGIKN
jgi:hypothetical protein